MRIYLAGHRAWSAAPSCASWRRRGVHPSSPRDRQALDLTGQAAVRGLPAAEKPDVVILAAAKVGGIHANNTYPADFIYENLMIEANVIHAGLPGRRPAAALPRLLLHLSARLPPSRMPEDALLTGPLEPTNEPYAIAKIAGIKLCESYNRQHGTRLPQRDAHQPLWPRRQLPSRRTPMSCRP